MIHHAVSEPCSYKGRHVLTDLEKKRRSSALATLPPVKKQWATPTEEPYSNNSIQVGESLGSASEVEQNAGTCSRIEQLPAGMQKIASN